MTVELMWEFYNGHCHPQEDFGPLLLSLQDHVMDICRKIQAAIGKYAELLIFVKKWKVRWFGHISRSSGLAKMILQGTVKRKRRKANQKKRWEDNIKEWTGMDFASSP